MGNSSSLAGRAYPVLEPLADTPWLQRRLWIIRTVGGLPDEESVAAVVRLIWERLSSQLPDGAGRMVVVSTIRIDDYHVGLDVTAPIPERQIGDELAAATWGVLREFDALWRVEELQGLPRDHWFIFRL
jgi:hypothetical protein